MKASRTTTAPRTGQFRIHGRPPRKFRHRLQRRLVAELLESRLTLSTAPLGDQFLVAETLGFEATPAALAVQPSGQFMVAWESYQSDGTGFDVFAQRYAADGSPLTATPFKVNSLDVGEQSAPALAVDGAGNVLVVWQSKDQDGNGYGIFGQWYDSTGTAAGGEFPINTVTAGDQKAPSVAMDGAGSPVIAWQSFGQDGSDWGIYYTRLEAVSGVTYDTTPDGDMLVNTTTVGIQQSPAVAAAANGNFVIAWEAIDPAGGSDASLDIYARVLDSTGGTIAAQMRVNTDTLRDQVTPQAAMDADGDFVVVWVGGGIPGSGSDIFGQRFNALGVAQGTQLGVNTTTRASQVGGVVAMDQDGNFLVAWQSVHQDGFSEGIYAREYGAAGTMLQGEFLVNTVTEGPQSAPSIGMNATGRAVVAWRGKNDEHESALFAQRFQIPNTAPDLLRVGGELQLASFVELETGGPAAAMDALGNTVIVFESYGQDGDGLGVYGQRLDNFGDPLGGPFLVNTGTTVGNQSAPAVARDADCNYVVVWQSNHVVADGYDIYAQRYTFDGTTLGGAIRVNSTVAGDQTAPVVAMGNDGRFVVAWAGDGGDGTTDIFAQRYDGAGVPVGEEFRVNNETALDQLMPAVAMNATGEFALAWVSSHPAAAGEEEVDPEKSIFVQWYDANGNSDGGDEVIAHNYVDDAQESPQIGIDAAGNFVVAWQSINQDGSTWGVYARQFLADKTPVQPDEFRVNEETEGLQRLVGLGVDADGNFVVAFESTEPGTDDGISTDIYRREFRSDWTPDGVENVVNTWTGGPQNLPVVARSATGNYGIFWLGQGFSHVDGVHGRLYDVNLVDDPGQPSRLPVADQFMVGATLGFENSSPALAVQSDGSFMLAYETFEEDGSGFGVFAQRFTAAGVLVDGSKTQVNDTTQDDQSAPAIATDGAGNVLIVWQSKDDADSFGIFGKWFLADGSIGDEFRLNTTTAGDQTKPDVAMDSEGRVVVAWQSQDGEGWDIYFVRLDGVGETIGVEQLANSDMVAGDQQAASVAAAATNGQFVIAWQGPGPVEEDEEASVEIFARRFAGDGSAFGGELLVNSTLAKDQILPDVALDDDGDAIFVWQAEGQTGSGSDVYARRMDSSGNLLGPDFLVNETKPRPQRYPAVAMDAAGNFLVTWQSQHQDGFSWGIYGHQYAADGGEIAAEFPINERVEGPQTIPNIASNSAGLAVVGWLGNSATHQPSVFAHLYQLPNEEPDFSVGGELLLTSFAGLEEMPPAAAMNAQREAVVAWTSYAEDGSGLGVFAQLLDRNGLPIGDRIAVNAFTKGNQGAPAVARAPDGPFVIVWQSEDQESGGEGYGIFAQRYSATGSLEGSTFQVNTTVAGDQNAPAVAIGPDGHFVIVWQSEGAEGLDIRAQRYLPDGTPDGNEFLVNTFTPLDQKDPAIAMNARGQFVIAWVSDHPAAEAESVDTEKSIFVQWFDELGNPPATSEVLVHQFVKDAQEAPAVGIDGSGRFVVAWQSINQDGNSWGVFARRFQADKNPLERREFVVNETRMGPQRYVGLGVDEFGRFVVTWQSNSRAEIADGLSAANAPDEGGGGGGTAPPTEEGSSWDIFSRQYGFDARREGGELHVNPWQMGPQIRPVVAQDAGGDFGIFWLGQGPDHTEGVHGRLYQSLFDFGDAPDPSYGTLLADDGARHLPWSTLYLGSGVDAELDGQPTADATGDDAVGSDQDEDGVVLPAVLGSGLTSTAVVTASGVGKLDAWIDYNHDGIFQAAEQIAASLGVVAGANELTFVVPATALDGHTFARFRISSAGGLTSDGPAVDGEVEDYLVRTMPPGTARTFDDPDNPGSSMLVVMGTALGDTVIVVPALYGQIRAQIGLRIVGSFLGENLSRIVAYGSAGSDAIWIDRRIDIPAHLFGNEGHDRLFGGGGNDRLEGGEGDDLLRGDGGADKLFGQGGHDWLFGGNDDDELSGGDGRDELFGESGNDLLLGEADVDVLFGGRGDDVMRGGEGADYLYGDGGYDILLGEAGNDWLWGGAENDLLIGGAGSDFLDGGIGDDLLIAGVTAYDADNGALNLIRDEWRLPTSYALRVANLRAGTLPKLQGVKLDDTTVTNDDVLDSLGGCRDNDWYFALLGELRDRSPSEIVG